MPVIDDVKIKKEFVDFEIFWNAIKVLVSHEGERTKHSLLLYFAIWW